MADTGEDIESSAKDAETPNFITEAQTHSTEAPAVNAGTLVNDAEAQSDNSVSDCAVCLEPMMQPTELPCKHVFCFLCVKGIAQKTRCCALCRREIPINYFDSPHLLNDPIEKEKGKTCSDDENKPLWYYKGRSGWWQYDDRTRQELENAHSRGEPFCEVLIAGYLYVIDFGLMTQYRKDDPIRRRSVKRDTHHLSVKGIAGVPLQKQTSGLLDQSNSSRPKKTPNHPSSSSLSNDVNEAGPSCSVFVFNLVPGTSGTSTSARPQTNKKVPQGSSNVSSNKVGDVIVISSEDDDDDDDAYDDFDGSDDDFYDDVDDDDNSDDDDDEEEEEKEDNEDEDDEDDEDDDSQMLWSIQFYGSKQGPSKRKASDSPVPPYNKKPFSLSSAKYKTALELMKAEHNYVKKSLKLKHIRSLVNKRTAQETQVQKNQNYIDLQELKRTQLEELRKFKRQHRKVNNLYD